MPELTNEEIKELIKRRRKQCLLHRFLYYVLSISIWDDFKYDKAEKELKGMVERYPSLASEVEYADKCPTVFPGSSKYETYPEEIVRDALRLGWRHAGDGLPFEEFLSRFGLVVEKT